jgi:hypothetical protein
MDCFVANASRNDGEKARYPARRSVILPLVIASAAEQSILSSRSKLDCFVAALLAMTGERAGMSRAAQRDLAARHCERSEAIHSSFSRHDGLLRRCAPRNDG